MPSQERSRQAALTRYYASPNVCRGCGAVIVVPDGVKVAQIRLKLFCTRSCANRYNNPRHAKCPKSEATKKRSSHRIKQSRCQACNATTYSRDGRRKYCDECYKLFRFPQGIPFADVTKGALFKRRRNWQSARSSIRSHAYRVFAQSGMASVCAICGYSAHVEIAHRRPVNAFPDEAAIKDINDLSNLMPLCRNHHWEFEHGLLDL